MVSDAKKKRDAAKKAKAGKPGSAKESPAVSTSAVRASGRPAYAVNGVAACGAAAVTSGSCNASPATF